jgi:raffinose/stachyose/melibiose transport system substrate-binding protein
MKRGFMFFFFLCCLTGVLFARGQQASGSTTLSLLFYSPELQSQYNDMVAAYKAETGVTLDITVLQTDFRSVLTSRINSGDIPDVFMSSAYADNNTYRDYSYDLTNEDFIKDIAPGPLAGVTVNGRVIGYPFLVQSHSFIYNKTVFRNLGITSLPRTLAEYDTAAQRIQAAGIQPFATGFKEFWVLPQTAWQAIAPVVVQKYSGYANFVSRLDAGTLKFSDVPEMANVFDLLDLIKKYGGPKPNESDFNDQTSMLATGKAAIIHQGNWAEDSIKQVNPNADIGFLVGPVGNDASGAGIMFDSNQTIRVNKNSKNLQATLAWLRWLTTSQYGKNWIPGKIKQLSPINGAAAPQSQIAEETVAMMGSGVPGYPWFYQMFPTGTEQELGAILQGYCAGLTDRRATLAALDDAYTKIARASR